MNKQIVRIRKMFIPVLLVCLLFSLIASNLIPPGSASASPLSMASMTPLQKDHPKIASMLEPESVEDVHWIAQNDNAIAIYWTPHQIYDDATDSYIPDPSIVSYRIYDDRDHIRLAETADTSYVADHLSPYVSYPFSITAVDQDGNESSPVDISAATNSEHTYKLVDNLSGDLVALSGDGTTVIASKSLENEDVQLLAIDTTTGDSEIMETLTLADDPEAFVLDKLAVNEDGSMIAYVSNNKAYIYDRAYHQTMQISNTDATVYDISISDDGQEAVYGNQNGIYLYRYQNNPAPRFAPDAPIAITEAFVDEGENPLSGSPAISGDGSRLAFLSNNPSLPGRPQELEGRTALVSVNLSTNEMSFFDTYLNGSLVPIDSSTDGMYVTFTESPGGWKKPYVVNTATGEEERITANLPENMVKDKNYGQSLISGDGQYVLASNYDYNPSGSWNPDYLELFNREDGTRIGIGNPATSGSFVIGLDHSGNRAVYIQNNSLYTYCKVGCDSEVVTDPVESVEWSIPEETEVFDEVRSGSTITITAHGQADQQLKAVVAYDQYVSDDGIEVEGETAAIGLTENSALPGTYTGTFNVSSRIAVVQSINR